MYQLRLNKYAEAEFKELDGTQKIFVQKGFQRIQVIGMQAGEALHGKLAGCRKLKNKKAGLRIVFREFQGHMEIIEIVAIGKRDKSEVYRNAELRL